MVYRTARSDFAFVKPLIMGNVYHWATVYCHTATTCMPLLSSVHYYYCWYLNTDSFFVRYTHTYHNTNIHIFMMSTFVDSYSVIVHPCYCYYVYNTLLLVSWFVHSFFQETKKERKRNDVVNITSYPSPVFFVVTINNKRNQAQAELQPRRLKDCESLRMNWVVVREVRVEIDMDGYASMLLLLLCCSPHTTKATYANREFVVRSRRWDVMKGEKTQTNIQTSMQQQQHKPRETFLLVSFFIRIGNTMKFLNLIKISIHRSQFSLFIFLICTQFP